jgi:hypothetical protein
VQNIRISVAGLIAAVALLACSGQDGDYFPYLMKGLNVYVYDNKADAEIFAGFVEASYTSQKHGLARCAALASSEAADRHLADWGYVCCTVTSESQCVTKVR